MGAQTPVSFRPREEPEAEHEGAGGSKALHGGDVGHDVGHRAFSPHPIKDFGRALRILGLLAGADNVMDKDNRGN